MHYQGIAYIEQGLKLNPREPRLWIYYEVYAQGLLTARRYEEAVKAARKSLELRPRRLGQRPVDHRPNLFLASALGHLGRIDEAKIALSESLSVEPDYRVTTEIVRPHKNPSDTDHFIEGLRKAGLPEDPTADEAADPPPLHDKPSIAVLPFENMSGDPEQEYFSDGITEDIITALSSFPWFFVIARNSTFSYKGTSPDIRQVAEELAVRYVLEGSVRKAGERVRISAQLIEGETGNHIWAERYDRELEDIFAVQDEITDQIIASVSPGIVSSEMQRAHRKDAQSLDVWDRLMRAHWHIARFTREDSGEARRLLTEAIEIDPSNALLLGELAMCHIYDRHWGWGESHDRRWPLPRQSLAAAAAAARRAVAADRKQCAGVT